MTEAEALQAVREWRARVAKSWEGKTWEEIRRELNESGAHFRETQRLIQLQLAGPRPHAQTPEQQAPFFT